MRASLRKRPDLSLACLFFAGVLSCFASRADVILDIGGRSSGTDRFAVVELTNVLSQTGCLHDRDVVFHIGETDFAKSKGLSSAALQDEEWVVKSFGKDVVLNGGGSRGCLYAAYHFLEDACGVRFFSDAETDVPTGKKRRDAASPLFKGLDLQGKPAFLYRDIYRSGNPAESTSLFAVRRRLNRNGDVPISESMGGAFTYGPPYHCHTFNLFVPWEKYGKEHPEWFSLWEGKRTGGMYGGQLCLSNPEVRAKLLEALRANIAAGDAAAKEAGVAAPRLYDVSQNDAYGRYCQCTNCMKEVEKYGHSGFYLNVINSLADEIAKERPEIFLTTLAYEYTEPPPKGGMRPRDNVIVKLCDTRSNQALSIDNETNAKWRSFVESWGKVAKHLLVWDYAIVFVNPANFWPMPGEFAYGDLFRFYRKNNVAGVFMEHEHRQLVDMYDLKYYLETKLLENPEADVEALIRDFCDRYYGPAGRFVFEARRHLDRIARERKPYITFMPKPTDYAFIRREDAVRMKDLFDAAEKAVADRPRFLARVRRARNTTDAIWRIRLAEADAKSGAVVWPAEACSVHDASRHALVDDPASPDGKAVRIGFPDVEFPPVPGFELYDAPKGKVVAKGEFVQAKDGAYAWTEVPDVTVPEHGNCFIYLAPDRTVQLRLWNPALNGKPFSLRILSRQDKSATYVARIEFTSISNKTTQRENNK